MTDVRQAPGLEIGISLLVRYNLRSLSTRRWGTLTTLIGVGIVVGVFCYILAFADGLRRALAITADPYNVIVLAEGATAESNSAVTHADMAKLFSVPGVAVDDRGRPLVSPEVVVQTNVIRQGDESGAFAGAAVRGLDLDVARSVHRTAQLVAGRWFRPGTDELVVGLAAAGRFVQGTMGAQVECGDRRFTVVGIFQAEGCAHESEFWGHLSNVAGAYRRDMYSSVALRLATTDESAAAAAVSRIASSAVALRAVSETRYYASQAENARIVEGMALLIVSLMSVGAVFAAMNSVYSALAGRIREIGMLRAIGFPRRALVIGFVAESIAVALGGGLLGAGFTALLVAVGGGARDLVGTTTFTSVVFTLQTRPAHVVYSLAVAAAIGLLGGLWPSRRATRIPLVESLRTA